jgi:hypothetical protein
MKFDTFFHGLLRKRVIRGDPCARPKEKDIIILVIITLTTSFVVIRMKSKHMWFNLFLYGKIMCITFFI